MDCCCIQSCWRSHAGSQIICFNWSFCPRAKLCNCYCYALGAMSKIWSFISQFRSLAFPPAQKNYKCYQFRFYVYYHRNHWDIIALRRNATISLSECILLRPSMCRICLSENFFASSFIVQHALRLRRRKTDDQKCFFIV